MIMLVLAASALLAQDTLRPIVITATRLPERVDHVAATVTVLDGAALRDRGVTHVLEALREVPGVHIVQNGGPGTVASLFLRGGESDYVKVLLDGVPLNQPGGFVDLSSLAMESVESIEVLRGPASVLYGSDAVSGVVSIRTRGATGPASVSASARAGSYGTTVVQGTLGGGSGRWQWSLSGDRTATDGLYDLNSSWTSSGVNGALRAAGSRAHARLAVRAAENALHYPTDFTGEPTDSNQYSQGDQRQLALETGWRHSAKLDFRAQLGWHDERLVTHNDPDAPPDVNGFHNTTDFDRISADLAANVRLAGGGVLTAGAAMERQGFRNDMEFTGGFAGRDTVNAERTGLAAYGQALVNVGTRLRLTAGARHDASRTSEGENTRLFAATTVRVGANFSATSRLRLRASAGTTFKEPTFFEQFGGGFSVGNRDLDPERGTTLELAAEQSFGRLLLSATAFHQRFRDMIQFVFGSAPSDPNYQNVAGARAEGLELDAGYRLSPRARLAVRFTWLHTEVTEQGADATFAEGRALIRRPAVAGGVMVDHRLGSRLRVDASLTYTGARDDLDFVNLDPGFNPARVTLPAHVRVDVGASYDLTRGSGLMLRIENLLDEDYQEVLYYPARGFTLLAGVRVQLGG